MTYWEANKKVMAEWLTNLKLSSEVMTRVGFLKSPPAQGVRADGRNVPREGRTARCQDLAKARFDCSHSQTKLAGRGVESATAQWVLTDRVVGSLMKLRICRAENKSRTEPAEYRAIS